MKLKGGRCPKCDSMNTTKEKIMGADTMDIICQDCEYIGHWKEFHEGEANKEHEKTKDS